MESVRKQDINTLLLKLESLESANKEVFKHIERINQTIRLVKFQIRDFVGEIDNYERLLQEEREFYRLGSDIDKMVKGLDDDIWSHEEMSRIVINNVFSPVIENNNMNKNNNSQ